MGPRDETASRSGRRNLLLDIWARQYGRPLYLFFSRRVSDSADVPDLVQDVLARLSKLNRLDDIEKPEHYIFRTASNVLRDRLRRRAADCLEGHLPLDLNASGDADIPPERVFDSKKAFELIQKIIMDLPERTRDVLVLRLFEGHKTREVGASLGISTRNVEMHYARALAAMAVGLKDHRDD